MKVWTKTEEFSEGKFLVTRRDGTTPDWPYFVLGARDPATPDTLLAYAREAMARGMDPDFVVSVRELAGDFDKYRRGKGEGDPDAPPHRRDLPLAVGMMRHELNVADIAAALERIRSLAEDGKTLRIQAVVDLLLDGKKPKAGG